MTVHIMTHDRRFTIALYDDCMLMATFGTQRELMEYLIGVAEEANKGARRYIAEGDPASANFAFEQSTECLQWAYLLETYTIPHKGAVS